MEKISEMTYTLTGLREGQELTFRAYAENKAGLSEPSQPSKPIKVRRPYGKELNTHNLLTITWKCVVQCQTYLF